MQGDLKVKIELSKALGANVKKLKEIIGGISKVITEGALKIIDIKGKYLSVSIKDDKPHATLLRLRNQLSQQLGKEFKVGWRGFKIISYSINVELEEKPKELFKMPFVRN